MSQSQGRFLERRRCACGCGACFDAFTRNKTQTYATRNCVNVKRSKVMSAMRVRSTYAARRSRWGASVQAIAESGRVTQAGLLALAQQAYKSGYEAGYQRASKGRMKGFIQDETRPILRLQMEEEAEMPLRAEE